MLITTDQRTDNEGRENRAINQRKINDTFQFDPIYKCPTHTTNMAVKLNLGKKRRRKRQT